MANEPNEPMNTTTAGDLAEVRGAESYDSPRAGGRLPSAPPSPPQSQQRSADSRPLPQAPVGTPPEVSRLMNADYWRGTGETRRAAVDAVAAAWERANAAVERVPLRADARAQFQRQQTQGEIELEPTSSLLNRAAQRPAAPYGPSNPPPKVQAIMQQKGFWDRSHPDHERLVSAAHEAWSRISPLEATKMGEVVGDADEYAQHVPHGTPATQEDIRMTATAAKDAGIGPAEYGALMKWAGAHAGMNETAVTLEQATEVLMDEWGSAFAEKITYAREYLREFPQFERWLARRSGLNSPSVARLLSERGEKRAVLRIEQEAIESDPIFKGRYDSRFRVEREGLTARRQQILNQLKG